MTVEMLVNLSVSMKLVTVAPTIPSSGNVEGSSPTVGSSLAWGTQLWVGWLPARAWEISVTQAVVLADSPFQHVLLEHNRDQNDPRHSFNSVKKY